MSNSVMTFSEILNHLPHRPPFLLIDRVIEIVPGKSLVAIKNVTINEPFFMGHFPQHPVMPGVLILEALAQAGNILALKTYPQTSQEKSLHFFAGIDNARFKRMVEPGDQLRLEVTLVKIRKHVMCVKGVASVNGEIACTADLMSAKKEVEE